MAGVLIQRPLVYFWHFIHTTLPLHPSITVMQNRPRRVLLASLAALALLILGSLFLFSSLGRGSEEGRGRGKEGGLVEMDAIQAMAASEVRFNAGPDGKLGVCYDPAS